MVGVGHIELLDANTFALEAVLDRVDPFACGGDDCSDRAVDNADLQLPATESRGDLAWRPGDRQQKTQLVGRSANPVPRDIDLEKGREVDGARAHQSGVFALAGTGQKLGWREAAREMVEECNLYSKGREIARNHERIRRNRIRRSNVERRRRQTSGPSQGIGLVEAVTNRRQP